MRSMTAYAGRSKIFQIDSREVEISVELKTVNSKFLDLQIRSPRLYNPFDRDLHKTVRSYLTRGRADLFINRRVLSGRVDEVQVNLVQATELFKALDSVREEVGISKHLEMQDLLENPDWLSLSESHEGLDEEKKVLDGLLREVLAEVVGVRAEEGASLQKALQEHLTQIKNLFESTLGQNEKMIQTMKERLKERISQVSKDIHIDAQRLEQEVVLFVSRADVQEETDRLKHHFESFQELIGQEKDVGRKLEFVLQEIHRELNTMGSKAVDVHLTKKVIDMKSLVERMREQSMNVE